MVKGLILVVETENRIPNVRLIESTDFQFSYNFPVQPSFFVTEMEVCGEWFLKKKEANFLLDG